jgi:hypothetical protein
MSTSLVPSGPVEEPEVPEGQKRAAVYRHPDRDMIHALIARGKDEKWINGWLAERYPVEDDLGVPHPEAATHRRWQISAETIRKYRREWMPECEPGVDVIDSKLESMIGKRVPARSEQLMELEVMEAAIAVSQHNLAKAMQQDNDMGMLQPITLEAQKIMIEAAKVRAKMAQELNQPGYEKAPEQHLIDQRSTSTNVSVGVEVHVDDSKNREEEPTKLSLMRKLLELEPDKARELVQIANEAATGSVIADATVVEEE